MAVATADASGRPSVRHVLLRGVDERGFRFFTNRESRFGNNRMVLASSPAQPGAASGDRLPEFVNVI